VHWDGLGMVCLQEHVLQQKPHAGDAAKCRAPVRLASLKQSKAAVKGLAACNKPQKTLDVDGVEVVPARGRPVAEHVKRRYSSKTEPGVHFSMALVRREGSTFRLSARDELSYPRCIYSPEIVAARD
jgi:hypothetical protein